MENMNKCPGCSHHCDRNNLQCGKGESYFSGEAASHPEHAHGHPDGKRHGHSGEKRHSHSHHRPSFPAGTLPDLLLKCGHRLLHCGDEDIFAVLADEEQTSLRELLAKLLRN